MAALLPPAAQPRRGDQHLQPNYFTSSLFVEPMRADISDLLKAYLERCKIALDAKEDLKPFEWFKAIWREQKWNLLHLRCIQPRPRKTFLEVTLRLFIERLAESEPVLYRITTLFAVYTFFTTQPEIEGTNLYRLPYIPIPIDSYHDLISLPATLPPTFDHYATYIILKLVEDYAFVLLPSSKLEIQSPSILPNSSVGVVPEAPSGKAKPGRPSALELQRRTIRAVSALDAWVSDTAPERVLAAADPSATDDAYAQSKSTVAQLVSDEAISFAEQSTIAKMKQLEEIWKQEGLDLENRDGLTQLGQALTQPDRLLGLSRAVNTLSQSTQPSPRIA